jgi:squalene-hopene/tetraprenyl-beta-curcumene cyclase
MKHCVGVCVLASWALARLCSGSETTDVKLVTSQQPAGTLDLSLRNEVKAAINRGLDWLAAKQAKDGSWSNPDFPALTALPLWAFAKGSHPRKPEIVKKAVDFILSCVQTNGGIYRDVPGRKGGGLSNYNTAICMTALHALGDPKLTPVVQNARRFIAGAQHFGDDVYSGGFGYDRDTQRAYTDLLNTYYTIQAMRMTEGVEDLRPKTEKRVDIDWKETVKFIERMQNKPEAGADAAGGFYYNPTDPKAGTSTNKSGVVVFRSYGSITYAGLLALIYANVSRDDVRVRSAFDWAAKHWSLDENPGMGQQGLYFFYDVLTRSLATYGQDMVPLKDGTLLNWREAVARKVVSLQKIDSATGQGYWQNETGRYWENDPVLVTGYSLLALEMAAGD